MNTAEDITGSALFLDRDGVINVDRGYVHHPDQFEFVPGIPIGDCIPATRMAFQLRPNFWSVQSPRIRARPEARLPSPEWPIY